jgi:fumarylacetoacetate (FAA) hydrolase
VAVTPDELDGWRGGRLHGALEVALNEQPLGRADPGVDMTFDFGQLIAHAAKTRSLAAGSIVGSGTVSNRGPDGGPGKPVAEGGVGYSCLAELRSVEAIAHGAPSTPFLRAGDRLRVEMRDARRHSIFGAIEQEIVHP